MNAYSCTLLRCHASAWLEFQEPVLLELNQYGLLFRVASSGMLVVDAPKHFVELVEEVKQHDLFRIQVRGEWLLAFRFQESSSGRSFAEASKRLGYSFRTCSEGTSQSSLQRFPDLADKNVRAFLLDLLFSESFHDYLDEVDALLRKWTSVTSLSAASQQLPGSEQESSHAGTDGGG